MNRIIYQTVEDRTLTMWNNMGRSFVRIKTHGLEKAIISGIQL